MTPSSIASLAAAVTALAVLAPSMYGNQVKPVAPAAARPASLPNRQEGDYVIKNYTFRSGAMLPEVRLHFTTIGIPLRDAGGKIRNGVLLMHGSSGDASQVLAASVADALLGPGQPLDATKHFVIFPDILGAGRSTKPSDGLRAKFPRYGYEDLVDLEHRLVTGHFGIDRLRLVMGISMGGMHTWMWGIRYPDMMDALVPVSSLPAKVEGRNLLWRRILSNAIRTDPAWNGGNYTEQPRGFLNIMPMFDMLVQSPAGLSERLPTYEKADEYVRQVVKDALEEDDANNILYRFEASFDYDPAPDLGKIKAPLLNILFAEDELNPIELGVIQREIPKVRGGRFVILPASPVSEAHRSQARADQWREPLAAFLATLPPPR